MVETQIKSRGIYDEKICSVMKKIPRYLFISGASKQKAYGDHPVSIGQGQTISQPYIVALMTQLLDIRTWDRVLEIGTGSGYQTAILAEIAREVYTIERVPSLFKRAMMVLQAMEYKNIQARISDGSEGWAEEAPFDRIIITAAAPTIPENLIRQLTDNGIMVVPIGDYRSYQVLTVIRRIGHSFETKESIGCRFVPLIGKYAFEP
ncbi:MAG: protein-L-isoaspartate(D-aspartate) O-methyltransferase [Spirochaetales bacterium]|nr:protein-L-isoaspartate(D-aspartate) O-methyltransferase [Spirochaetales bacterium]